MIERVELARGVAEVAVATTDRPEDAAVCALARSIGIRCFAGDADDVLDRYYHAARTFDADPVVRLTGDCPLIDPDIVAAVLDLYLGAGDAEHVALGGRFPDGLDTEVVALRALTRAWSEARLPSEREHVTPYIWKNPERFRLLTYSFPEDRWDMRWTVDQPSDLAFVRAVYARLYSRGRPFGWREIVDLVERVPEIKALNTGIARNAGYIRSLEEDRAGARDGYRA
jgi:spore coat polysaccharide biosynthesis protein SpsF